MNASKIEWADVTDNPFKLKTGGYWCRKISEGCANCYAERLSQNSFLKGSIAAYHGDAPEMVLDEKLVSSWGRMRKSKKHFVASMTDVFGEWLNVEEQVKMLFGMASAEKQIFQVLTKRPQQASLVIDKFLLKYDLKRLPDNIWIGVSIENRRELKRSFFLSMINCNRFWSVEPLLEDLGDISELLRFHNIGWVIVGGESGQNSRVCNQQWIEKIIKQCKSEKLPVFLTLSPP